MKKLTLFSVLFFLVFQGTSQVSLQIECYKSTQNIYYNKISMDGQMVEYGYLSSTPSFYVAIIDTNCVAWGTQFDSENIDHDFGNYNGNFSRVMHYFTYYQTDSLSLVHMDSLLNTWIPDGHVIAIWTPVHYNFNDVNTVCPRLGNTLLTKWGPNVQSDSIIVLFGEQGNPQSFSVDTLTNGESIIVTKEICSNLTLGIDEYAIASQKSIIRVVDLMGRETDNKSNTLLIYIYSDGTTEKVFRLE